MTREGGTKGGYGKDGGTVRRKKGEGGNNDGDGYDERGRRRREER